uniref:Gustatory receptor n=1 Tax=Anopheles epiroticus TaxID=199890 RepID=A0A182PZ16_9DIPT
MWSERLERCMWYFLLVCGLFPLQFVSGRLGRFSTSRKLAVYCGGMTVAFAVVSPTLLFLVYKHQPLANVFLLNIMNAVQLSFIYLFMIVMNVTMLINAETLCSTLNALFAIRGHILQHWSYGVPMREYTWRLFYKTVLVDLVLLLFSLIMFYVSRGELLSKYGLAMGIAFVVFRYVISALSNLYLVGMMIASLIQGSINSKLASLADGRSGPEELETTVRQLYLLHCQTAQLEKQFMAILNLPVLLLNGWYFFMVVLAAYYIYTSTMVEVKRGLDVGKYLNSVSFLVYLFIQLYYMMVIPSQYTERSKRMLPILGSINQQCRGRRTERMLELITLDSLQRDHDVWNYGMYEINRMLLFGAIATVTSYVIILVQFHMQEYG